MLRSLFYAPEKALQKLREFAEWCREPTPLADHARTYHPNGGRCHECGRVCADDSTECVECWGDRQI